MNLQSIAVVVTLSLACAAGCKKPTNETSDTRTTAATNEGARTATPNEVSPASPNAPTGTTETTGMTGSTGATERTGATGGATTIASSDLDFMKKAAVGGLFEVKTGQEAMNRATRADVKTFAQHMVTDHGKANNELKDLAAKKNVAIPTELDDEHTKKLNDLMKLSGPQFDDKYAKEMLDDHEKDVKEFQKEANDAKDPDLRSWVTTTLPTLQSHLQMARDMEGKKGAASTGAHHPH